MAGSRIDGRRCSAEIRCSRAEDVLADLMRDCPYQDSFYRLMYFNYKVSLPDDMLTKVDRMTMASSLEARVPFLDYRLVELMSGVHKSVKLDGLTRKAVLRKTVGRKLPEALLAGSKRGFVTPLRSWFRQGDFAETLIRKSVAVTGFSRPVVDSILAEQRDRTARLRQPAMDADGAGYRARVETPPGVVAPTWTAPPAADGKALHSAKHKRRY